jgi:hypothetical protein
MQLILSSEDKVQRAIEAALVTRAFQSMPGRMPTMTAEQQGYARELRSISLQGIARLCCRAHRLEAPEDPEIVVQTDKQSPQESIDLILADLLPRLRLK